MLISRWVGDAWEELSQRKEIAVRALKKCGISTAADGSEDFEIHLEGVEDYKFTMDCAEDDIEDDPFANLSDDSSSFTEDSCDDER